MRALLALGLALQLATAAAATPSGYLQRPEVKQFIKEMVKKHHFARKDLERVFREAQYQPAIIKAMNQPLEVNSWQVYRTLFVNPLRVDAGVQFWDLHKEPLQRAAAEFGVPEEIIVAIIGVETIYGRNVGTYRVIDSLSTLAFDYPKRSEYFRLELENYLVFARDAHLNTLLVKGSYAGAIGIPQFMPGTYRRYAVDYDGDGQINLASSPADAIGSIGNFLKEHGWIRGQPVAYGVEVSGDNWRKLTGGGATPAWRVADLPQFGVKLSASVPAETLVALIQLETPGQPSDFRLGLKNFQVLTRYNHSNLYATAVFDLAAGIARSQAERRTPLPAPVPESKNP